MKISVVIPTYNREKTIKRSIESVLNQTVPVHEIIVVDDCSVDNTRDVIEGMNNSIIRYVKLEANAGAGAARNYGVALSTGDWIAFNDSDDEWTTDKIEKCCDYSERNPDIEVIYSSYKSMQSGGICPLVFDMDHYDGDMLRNLFIQNTVGAPTMVISKSAFDSVGGFEESLRIFEDWDLAIKLAQKYRFGFIPDSLLNVYRVDRSVSYDETQYFKTKCYMIGKYKKELLEYGLFNSWVLNLMKDAESRNVKEYVEKMLVLYLQM